MRQTRIQLIEKLNMNNYDDVLMICGWDDCGQQVRCQAYHFETGTCQHRVNVMAKKSRGHYSDLGPL